MRRLKSIIFLGLTATVALLNSCGSDDKKPTPVPSIASFMPTSGLVGATVTITGENFSSTSGENSVRFNGTIASVSASTSTSITVTVPAGATTGKIAVQVGSLSSLSATDFTVTSSNTWRSIADLGASISAARSNAVAFSIEEKGYVTTGFDGSTVLKDLWEYDAVVNTWSQKADFAGAARTGAVGFAIGARGYVGTGSTASGNTAVVGDFWEYNPSTNAWTQKADLSSSARWLAVGFSIGSKGYVAMGEVSGGNQTRGCWEYDPSSNTWTSRAAYLGLGRSRAAAFSLNGKGYVGTGATAPGVVASDFYEFDPVANAWTAKASFPVGLYATFGVATSTRGYVGGGADAANGNTGLFYEYNPSSNTWAQRANYPNTSGLYSSAFALPNQRIYLGTGAATGGTRTRGFFEYQP
jgi:N-acetylneuraminic acid mutarotase